MRIENRWYYVWLAESFSQFFNFARSNYAYGNMIIEIEESVEETVNRVNKGNWKIIVKEREKKNKEKRRVRKCTVIKDRLSSGLPRSYLSNVKNCLNVQWSEEEAIRLAGRIKITQKGIPSSHFCEAIEIIAFWTEWLSRKLYWLPLIFNKYILCDLW